MGRSIDDDLALGGANPCYDRAYGVARARVYRRHGRLARQPRPALDALLSSVPRLHVPLHGGIGQPRACPRTEGGRFCSPLGQSDVIAPRECNCCRRRGTTHPGRSSARDMNWRRQWSRILSATILTIPFTVKQICMLNCMYKFSVI